MKKTLLALLLLIPPHAMGQDIYRGGQLFENHCQECHHPSLLWREQRIVTSWEALVAMVYRWQQQTATEWSKEEFKDVISYLDWRYYQFRHFPMEPPLIRRTLPWPAWRRHP